jgi:1-deoxy-D-xylulose-5-phosphate synthase
VGADGATHAGSFDLSYARCIPNMAVLAPADEAECRAMLQTAYEHRGPALVRYPRGSGPGALPAADLATLPWGKGELRRQGGDIVLLAFGTQLGLAEQVADELGATVANMRFIKPLDEQLVLRLAGEHRLLVTLEENVVMGGAGSAVAECLAAHDCSVPLIHFGLPDRYQEQGTQSEQLADAGLTPGAVIARIRQAVAALPAGRQQSAGLN